MAEEKKIEKASEPKPKISLGGLVLWAVLAQIAFTIAGIPTAGPVIPFAVLGAMWYGIGGGVIVGAVGFLFSDLVLLAWTEKTWFQVLGAAVGSLLGLGGEEKDFLWRVIVATIVFEVVAELFAANFIWPSDFFSNRLPTVALALASNIVVAVALDWLVLRQKD